jgi:GT2 family glycosyltransferase
VTDIDISVVMPVRNAESTIRWQLDALTRQEQCEPWELILADNGCTDGTLDVVSEFLDRIPSMRVVDASDTSGVAHARNVGASAARGSRILFCDADDVVAPAWIATLSKRLETCSLVAGACRMVSGPPDVAQFADPFPDQPPRHAGWRDFALGCNLGVHSSLVDRLSGFDSTMVPAEDIDFSWRALQAGEHLCFEPQARVLKVRRDALRAVWRQHESYGRIETDLRSRFAEDGCPLASRQITRSIGWLIAHPLDPFRRNRRRTWVAIAARTYGMLRSVDVRNL